MPIIAETVVQYNQSARVWETWDAEQDYEQALIVGGVTAYPAGSEGKRAALLSALTRDAPAVAAIVETIIQRWPDNAALIDRALRAGFLVKDGHVKASGEVISSDRARWYQVRYAKLNGFTCTCADWEDGRDARFGWERESYAPQVKPLGVVCKHALAVFIAGKLRMSTAEDQRRAEQEREIDFQDQLINQMVDEQLYGGF